MRLGLADGVVLSVSPRSTALVDFQRDRRVPVGPAALSAAEAAALGDGDPDDPALAPLLAEGWVGPARDRDRALEARLAALDQPYLGAYAHELGRRERAAYDAALAAHALRKRFYGWAGQAPVLPETALRRALLVGDAARVGKRRVLCVGDDDLVSIPLAALGHEVTVWDVDRHLLAYLRRAGERLGLAPTLVYYDARDPVPPGAPFDCFVSDPMSNRQCFELFLSRAFAVLEPSGRAFVSVHPPTSRLFAAIAGEMGFAIVARYRKHNHYYSPRLVHDGYDSDWLEVAPTPALRLPVAAGAAADPPSLYADDFDKRPATLLLSCRGIDTRFAKPLFLHDFLDLCAGAGLVLGERFMEIGDDWTVAHGPVEGGTFVLRVDRRGRELAIVLRPYRHELASKLRDWVVAGFGAGAVSAHVLVGRTLYDLRLA